MMTGVGFNALGPFRMPLLCLETFFLGTAMSSMDPPMNGKLGKPSPEPLLSELEIWSDSGKTHCGDLVGGLNRPSVGDGIAIE